MDTKHESESSPFADKVEAILALPPGSRVLLVGATDTGKTTFARQAVAALSAAGRSVGLVDADLGQSELGPPGTIGAVFVPPGAAGETRSLRDLPLAAGYFIGATSPARHLLETSAGLHRVTETLRSRSPDLVLIDTGGLIPGRIGAILTRQFAELTQPQAIVAFQRGSESEPALAAFAHLKIPLIWRVSPGPEVGRKPPAMRQTRRAARFAAALEGASEITLSWDDIALLGTRLGSGTPLAYHQAQFAAQSLRLPVLHAEQGHEGLYLVVNGERWDMAGLGTIEGHFRVRDVLVVPAKKFARLLVGLVSADGALLDIGLIARIDFAKRTLTLLTPCRRPAAIAQVWCGILRLRPDGRELGENRPGEL